MIDIVRVAMDAIAEATGRAKVVKRITTALSTGYDMLNRHGVNREKLFAVNAVAAISLENPALAVELLLFLLCGTLSHGFSACQKQIQARR
jgi:hypothetical protein